MQQVLFCSNNERLTIKSQALKRKKFEKISKNISKKGIAKPTPDRCLEMTMTNQIKQLEYKAVEISQAQK